MNRRLVAPRIGFVFIVITLIAVLWPSPALAATPNPNPTPIQPIFGVYVDADGALRHRETDANSELAAIRAKGRATTQPSADGNLRFVSLPKLFANVRSNLQGGKPIPTDMQYLEGITQLRYVLVYPNDKDLVIAGPAEPVEGAGTLQPKGNRTGRPVLQLDDLVVAMRLAAAHQHVRTFGCSIDPPDHSVQIGQQVLAEYGGRSRRELADALVKALGPQQVRFFGVPEHTRVAFVCVAADYMLKRYSIGLDPMPIPGIGHSINNTRAAGNGFWFETLYEPLLVSADHNAFAIRGPRLQLKAGAVPFDEQGATPKAKAWAKQITEKLPALAAAVPLYADLQNIADLALLAKLIRQDNLDQRVGWDSDWVMDESAYRVKTVAVPRSTDTLVNYTSGSLAAGGVGLSVQAWVAHSNRQLDRENVLTAVRETAARR